MSMAARCDQRSRLLGVAVCLLALPGLGGCSIRQQVLRETGEVLEEGMVALNAEQDYLFVREAMPGNLKTLEILLAADPENPSLLLLGAQGFAAYSYLVLEDELDLADAAADGARVAELKLRAAGFYTRAAGYALRRLGSPALQQALDGADLDALRQAVAKVPAEQAPALFWLVFAYASRINLDQSNPARIAELPKAEILLERTLALDGKYWHGLPLLMAGVFHAGRPPMFGGDAARGRGFFEQGIAVSQGKFLLGPFLLARFYAIQAQDRDLFCQQLNALADADLDLLPEQGLMNSVSRRWALRWRDRVGGLFEGGEGSCVPAAPPASTTEEDDGILLQ